MPDEINTSTLMVLRGSIHGVTAQLDGGWGFDKDRMNDLADECDSLVGALEAAWLRLTAKQTEDNND